MQQPTIASRESLLEAALADVLRMLEGLSTPVVRELRSQARSYEKTLKRWATVPPTDDQLDAMFDVVGELSARAAAHRGRGPTHKSKERETLREIPAASTLDTRETQRH